MKLRLVHLEIALPVDACETETGAVRCPALRNGDFITKPHCVYYLTPRVEGTPTELEICPNTSKAKPFMACETEQHGQVII